MTVAHPLDDLLSRPLRTFDAPAIGALVRGRTVLVTGAGGSIGSEISRQLATHAPRALVLLDRHEHGLDAVATALQAQTPPACPVQAVVGDITDEALLDRLLRAAAPHLIFHAAAHKHVPLMEINPCEAVRNNVRGTRLVMEAAHRHGVARCVVVSTDKAVQPSSVMGATKRIAEQLVQATAGAGGTAFLAVRFGNVLGSAGSVVPRFLAQIAQGGPVTVTHPEVQRYFMLTPEAVHLVLHAATQAHPGGVYMLDMGAQIRVLDVARALIRRAGLEPDRDVPIVFTGLRPGEKLTEVLSSPQERVVATATPGVRMVVPPEVTHAHLLRAEIQALEAAALQGDAERTRRLLADLARDER